MEHKQPVATMREWVDYVCDRRDDLISYGAEHVADGLDTADLFAAHSEATIALAGSLPEDDRDAWNLALAAICRVLGHRIDRCMREA